MFFSLPPSVYSFYMFLNIFLYGFFYIFLDMKSYSHFYVEDYYVGLSFYYTFISIQVLWVSFYSVKDKSSVFLRFDGFENKSIKFIFYFLAISIFSIFISISQRMFGYVAEQERVDFLSYLTFASNLGFLSIILTVFYYYKESKSAKLFLFICVVFYFIAGIGFGSKSVAVMPIFFVIISFYFSKIKIPKIYYFILVFSLGLSYVLIEPFRVYYDSVGKQDSVENISQLTDVFLNAQIRRGTLNEYATSFITRQDYLIPLAKTLKYGDEGGQQFSEAWVDLLMSPLYGVIPRLVWPTKPLANFGSWASVNIFELPETTHTGITPQGYAYLVQGLIGIIIIFYIYGLFQRFIFNLFFLNKKMLPFYLLMYLDLGYPAVVPWTFFAGMIQRIIFMSVVIIIMNIYQGRQIFERNTNKLQNSL